MFPYIVGRLFSRYVPGISSIPLNQGMRWLPLWSTLPTYATWKRVMDKYYPEEKQFGRMRSPILVQLMELMAFRSLSKAARGEQFIQGVLFPKRVRYAFPLIAAIKCLANLTSRRLKELSVPSLEVRIFRTDNVW